MSRYTGPQQPGANRLARAEKRRQAELRHREESERDILRRAGIYCDTSGHNWQLAECSECGGMQCYAFCTDCPGDLRQCETETTNA